MVNCRTFLLHCLNATHQLLSAIEFENAITPHAEREEDMLSFSWFPSIRVYNKHKDGLGQVCGWASGWWTEWLWRVKCCEVFAVWNFVKMKKLQETWGARRGSMLIEAVIQFFVVVIVVVRCCCRRYLFVFIPLLFDRLSIFQQCRCYYCCCCFHWFCCSCGVLWLSFAFRHFRWLVKKLLSIVTHQTYICMCEYVI